MKKSVDSEIAALKKRLAELEASKLTTEKKSIAKPKTIIVRGKKPIALSEMEQRMKQIKQELKDDRNRAIKTKKSMETIYKNQKDAGLYHVLIKFEFTITFLKEKPFTTPPTVKVFHFTIKSDSANKVKTLAKNNLINTMKGWDNEYSYYTLRKIQNIQIMDHRVLAKNANYNVVKEKMKASTPVEFSWVPSIKFQNDGKCTYNALASLKKKPKAFEKPEKLLKLFQEFENEDAALEARDPEVLTIEAGVSPQMIQKLCVKYDMTHYCLDIERNTLLKHITKNFHYEPLCYIAHSGHMYLITDKKFINKLSFSRSNTTQIIGLTRDDEEKDDQEAKFPKLILENTLTRKLHKLKDCAVIMTRNNLESLLLQLHKMEKVIYKHTSRDNKIVKIEYKDNVTILADPNADGQMYDGDKAITWRTVKRLCAKYKIPFMNQSFAALVMQLLRNVIKPKRVQLTKEQKNNVKKNQKFKCNICEGQLKTAEYDHIIPLAANGTNDLSNIQALCIQCHFSKSRNEQNNGEYMTLDAHTSTFNLTGKQIIHSDLFKRYAFIEKLGNTPKKHKSFYIDINKTRKNILYYLKHLQYEIPVFTCMDEPMKFNSTDSIKAGFYFIESHNYFPLRENGWYSHAMVQYCLDNKIIKKENIKWKFTSSLTLGNDYFNKAIEVLLTLPGTLSKLGPNILIGCSAKDTIATSKTFFTQDFRQASTEFMKNKLNNVTISQNGDLYQVTQTEKVELDIANSCIYNMVVDIEACELHKLKTLIEQNNGTVTFLNTDCCECYFKDNVPVDITQYFWDNEKTVRKYKFENKTESPSYERMANFKHNGNYSFDKPEWNVVKDPETNDFEPVAKQIIESGKGFNLNGIAGSGKTSMLRTIMKQLDEKQLKYQVLCPTNKSARVVSKNALTIHKFLAKGFSNMKSLRKQTKDLAYIIVDEISMVREMFYKVFLSIKGMGNIKFIIAGDWRQLAPVNDRAEFNYKDSLALLELCDGNRLDLTKCRRSDDKLFKASLQVDTLNTKQFKNGEYDISICWTNKKRKQINEKWMEEKSKDKYKIYLPKLGYDHDSQDTTVFVGLPVIARVNDRKNEIYNNETFTVKKINENSIVITDDGIDKDIATKDFMRLFNPAYCMTVHRVQGTTISTPFTIYQWAHFDTRMKYTALTRGTNIENINFA